MARRFNRLYGEVFPVPIGAYGDRLVGTDGARKMGKSYGNAIGLTDSEEAVRCSVSQMVTDPGRVRRSDRGTPEVCGVYRYAQRFSPERADSVAAACRVADTGCTACKADLAVSLNRFLGPFRERREIFATKAGVVRDILNLGGSTARIEGQRTLERVKEAMGLQYQNLLAG